MTNTILQIVKIDPDLIEEIKSAWHRLPQTDHADGKYRLRKYSYVECNIDNLVSGGVFITDLKERQFTQSSKYNKHQGDKVRTFDLIDDNVLRSNAMRKMVSVFQDKCSLPGQFRMNIHQVRVVCTGRGATQLSPEGWHQDGYDCIAMIGIDRCNIIGGELLLSTSKTERPFLQAVMDDGTMVIIDDSHLWHNGMAIQPIRDNKPAWMDIFIFTAKTWM